MAGRRLICEKCGGGGVICSAVGTTTMRCPEPKYDDEFDMLGVCQHLTPCPECPMRYFLDVCRGTLWREAADDVFERLEGFADRGSGEVWRRCWHGEGGPDWKAVPHPVGRALVSMARQMWRNQVDTPGGHGAAHGTDVVPCQAVGPHHGDRCNGGRVQSPNAQFTQDCPTCDGTGEVHSHNPRCPTCGGQKSVTSEVAQNAPRS